MRLTPADVAHLMLAAALLLTAAHLTGGLLARWRYPRVVGEIVGGLILGPSLLGALLPGVEHGLFPAGGATTTVLSAFEEFGVIFLMFAAGAEFGVLFGRGERRTPITITITGVLLPFTVGILAFHCVHIDGIEGSAHATQSLGYVFAAAVAVTSIPAIARVMMDLGVASSSFARVVLGSAAIEDVVLYVVLSIAVGLAENATGTFGMAKVLGIRSGSAAGAVYYAAATLIALGLAFAVRRALRGLDGESNPFSSVAAQVIMILAVTGACMLFSITSVFGGFAAGIMIGGAMRGAAAASYASIKHFIFAFFIPLYFAIVGWRLDLVHHFDVPAFFALLIFASLAKAVGVYVGARIAGERRGRAFDFAVVMNARGGMGIVLASVALSAHIISEQFYADIVVLSIVTLLAAGLWLERIGNGWAPSREAVAGGNLDGSRALAQTR